ncbi:hypothetical protein GBAR_LOCUS15774 [Geodia barretti]|nr:hypothetical protein GBAR_LOCUS15774 [Geodia barretti]
MAQKIAELEKELLKQQTTQINKRSCMFPEPDIHEDLDIEYGKVVTSFEVLTLVERNFKDSFDAKGFLCDIFMDAYKYCKEFLKEIVCKNIDELFKVQTCETRTDDMEGLSYAFGQLLQYSGIKLELITTQAVSVVKKKVKELAPKLPRFKKATVEPAIETLPLDKFVKLAWKFITQSCPVIVSMPPMLALNEEIHKTSFHHWDEKRREERPLIYAQPVVYRSFHGEVLIKGLVGNF